MSHVVEHKQKTGTIK